MEEQKEKIVYVDKYETVRLDKETSKKLNELKYELKVSSKNAVIDKLIEFYYSRRGGQE